MEKKLKKEQVTLADSPLSTLEKKEWNPKDDNRLIEMVSSNDYFSWEGIAKHFIQKTGTECFFHYEELRKEFDFLPISKFELPNGSIPLGKEVFPKTIESNLLEEEKLKVLKIPSLLVVKFHTQFLLENTSQEVYSLHHLPYND